MAYNVTITYNAANDLFNAAAQDNSVVSPVAINGLASKVTAPSDAYIYASDSATAPVYNNDGFITYAENSDDEMEETTNLTTYIPGSQRRWPKVVTDDISTIIETYATPQVPVYRAWQTFKMAITSNTPVEFSVETFAASEFYREAGKALGKYGITVETELVVEESTDESTDGSTDGSTDENPVT